MILHVLGGICLVLYECSTDCCVTSANAFHFLHNFLHILIQAYETTAANFVMI